MTSTQHPGQTERKVPGELNRHGAAGPSHPLELHGPPGPPHPLDAAHTHAQHKLRLRLECSDHAQAERLRAALAADEPGSVSLSVAAKILHVDAKAPTLLGLLRTAEDVLVCLRAAGL